MSKVGVYGCCGNAWGFSLHGVLVRPVCLPISEDGSTIIAACEICAPDLPVARLAELAMDAYIASSATMPVEPQDARMGFHPAPQWAEPTVALRTWVGRQQELGVR